MQTLFWSGLAKTNMRVSISGQLDFLPLGITCPLCIAPHVYQQNDDLRDTDTLGHWEANYAGNDLLNQRKHWMRYNLFKHIRDKADCASKVPYVDADGFALRQQL